MRYLTALITLWLILTPDYCTAETTYFKNGMVASEHRLASAAGIEILNAGGNAVDAAVAVGYALAVVNPCCGNIGGGGFMLVHLANDKNITLNFREKAPLKANKTMFLDKQGNLIPNATTTGYLAVAVPGTVLGLETALKQYGTMTRQQVMAPAIRLAQYGYKVTPFEANQFAKFADDFRKQPNVAAIFLKHGKPYQAGDVFIQTDLTHTLKLIQEKGANEFYKGSIASTIVAASHAHGGILSLQDFADYTVTQSSPIQCLYRGYQILTVPPPSGGSTLCTMLEQLQKIPLQQEGYRSAQSITHILEAMRYGFLKRNSIHPNVNVVQPHHELTDTTHYSIVDKYGNAVAVTYTINGFFGARVIADHTGFFLNDEMDDFTTKYGTANKFGLVQSAANIVDSGKRPFSSMSPTIILKNHQPWLVIGSPGGPRIITTILLTLVNLIDYKMPLQAAVDAPRFHYQGLPNTIDAEPQAFTPGIQQILFQEGYHITPQTTWGAIEAIQLDEKNHSLIGANDYRRPDGAALKTR